jgi:hypothetical protein
MGFSNKCGFEPAIYYALVAAPALSNVVFSASSHDALLCGETISMLRALSP